MSLHGGIIIILAYVSENVWSLSMHGVYLAYPSENRCDQVLYKEYFIYLSKDRCDHGRYMGAFSLLEVRQTWANSVQGV